MNRTNVKHSIRRRFALIFLILMISVIFLCWLVNTLFLEKYYLRSKTNVIYSAYLSIKMASENNNFTSNEFRKELEHAFTKNNISAYVMDETSNMKYVSDNGGERLEMQLFGYLLGYPFGDELVILREESDYRIQRMHRGDNVYLEMVGRLSTGVSFIMSTPLESIEESADLANRFFFYVGVIGTFLGGVIIWFVTGRITKPILSLNEISERMVNLDFDAKYEGKAKNEIGLLGENMNKLSQSLEKNISDLKSANNELTRDIEKKDKIDEMRREFLSNVSHELKTPIALIQGYAEALQEGIGEDPESKDYYCEVIVDEAAKMNQIVQKLMTLNQLEFGREVAQMERFELTSLIQNALSQSEILAQKNGIKIELSAAEEVHVWADAFMTEEVFQNYLSNAIHYCSGEKKIKISVEHKEDTVRISVFNTGATIPEESLPLLWDKFYKVDKARTREYGGSGVGLSIVKAMMESMNQGYGVLNEADGVTFWFELECADRKSEG
ncbi:MAG: HAMP domain-containing histidine kinase [Acetatifactor sp.]|nr:HAMP domain-containing histidine kinase [Acetatifactor sp.]